MDFSTAKINSQAINDGVWRKLDEYGDLMVRVRGITYSPYVDLQGSMQRAAAKGYGGDTDLLPQDVKLKINTTALIRHILVDVKNATEGGMPLNAAQFGEKLLDANYREVLMAVFRESRLVAAGQTDDAEEAAKN